MTAPTITYGHGFLEDAWATLADDYTLTAGGSTGSFGVSTSQNLYINITTRVGDAYAENDDDIDISTTLYPTFICRYCTTGSAKAKIVAVFDDASTQTLLTDTANTDFTVVKATLTTGKTLDHLRFYNTTGTGFTNYDFVLVCKGVFTFPQYTRIHYSMTNRYSNVEVASRIGRRKSWSGANELIVVVDGDLDSQRDGWKRPVGNTTKTDVLAAQVLDEIHHNADTETFQWFTCDRGQFKAVMEALEYTEGPEQPFLYAYHVVLSEYLLVKGQTDNYAERLGLATL